MTKIFTGYSNFSYFGIFFRPYFTATIYFNQNSKYVLGLDPLGHRLPNCESCSSFQGRKCVGSNKCLDIPQVFIFCIVFREISKIVEDFGDFFWAQEAFKINTQ